MYQIESIMPEGRMNEITYLQETIFLRLFVWQMCIISVHKPKCSCLYLCVAASELRPSGMAYILLFYVDTPSISDYANVLVRPSGMMPSKYF
jgi:hypothetical protein